jgi:hypothetical protein
MTNKQTQKPVTTLRDGRISASVWKNETEKGSFYAVTFSRVFTNGEGNPQNSGSFSGTELLKLARLAAKAYDQIGELAYSVNGTDDADLGE